MPNLSLQAQLDGSLQRESQKLGGVDRIVFDLDGTVYDTRDYERPALGAVAQMLREKSGQSLETLAADLWARRERDRHRPGLFDEVLNKYGLPLDWGGECLEVFHAHAASELASADSLKAYLSILRASGHCLALVSNGLPAVQARKLERLALADVFDECVICGPDLPKQQKPSPWAWSQLADWRGNHPAIYVGDDPVDEQFAKAGGAGFVFFNFRSPKYAD